MTRLRKGRQRSRKVCGKGRQFKEQDRVRKNGDGRWQHMRLYSHNNPEAWYRADKAAGQRIRR